MNALRHKVNVPIPIGLPIDHGIAEKKHAEDQKCDDDKPYCQIIMKQYYETLIPIPF